MNEVPCVLIFLNEDHAFSFQGDNVRDVTPLSGRILFAGNLTTCRKSEKYVVACVAANKDSEIDWRYIGVLIGGGKRRKCIPGKDDTIQIEIID